MKVDLNRYLVLPGDPARLADRSPDDDGSWDRKDGEKRLETNLKRLDELQELLFADCAKALLIVFQAMDTGGKDSTIRKVMRSLNPQGVRVWNFEAPSPRELAHDYLWRTHHRIPRRGCIGVHNRSHYEEVLVVRVKNLVAKQTWQRRYRHINDFERLLTDEGTTVLKFYLHISRAYQKKRLQRRLARPDKHWKFNPEDLKERTRWDDYAAAYEDAITKCSTPHAPWYVIPAERRWYRNLLVSEAIRQTLEGMDLKFPRADFDPATITID